MEFTGNCHHQGDTQWFELKELPIGLNEVPKQFVAASERSGSFHALFGNYNMYETEGGFIVDVKEECILNHSLKQELDAINNDLSKARKIPKKDHNATVLAPGIYFTAIQVKFDPMAGHWEKVLD